MGSLVISCEGLVGEKRGRGRLADGGLVLLDVERERFGRGSGAGWGWEGREEGPEGGPSLGAAGGGGGERGGTSASVKPRGGVVESGTLDGRR